MPEESDNGPTYAERMRAKGVQVRPGGWTTATHDQVAEGRTDDGGRFKQVTDQLGHQVVEETTSEGRQRKHVRINLQ